VDYQDPHETEYHIVKSCPLLEFYLGSFEDAFDVDVCLGDFGMAVWKDEHLCELVQPIDLRAPEVILGLEWDEKIDLWSLGIIMFEVYRCTRLFNSRDHTGYSPPYHLMQMQQMFGQHQAFPQSLLKRAASNLAEAWFGPDDRVRTYENVGVPDLREETWVGRSMDGEERDLFVSWLHFVMRLDPRDRPGIGDVLRHPWLTLTHDLEIEDETMATCHEMF
jgi:serine/threonine-protein kinase SRPK3